MGQREPATEAPAGLAQGPPRYTQPVRVASWLLLGFLCLLAFGSLATQVDTTLSPTTRVAGTLITVIVAVGFIDLQRHVLRRWRSRRTVVAAAVVVGFGLLNEALSDTWTLVGVSIAAAMLVVPNRWSFAAGLAVWLTSVGETLLAGPTLVARIGVPLTTLLTAVMLYTLTRLSVALTEAHYAREQLARTHVDSERHRISRDLHDIIGRTLVAASLRNEAALQLLDRDVDRAREQLMHVQETISRGQADLRRLTSGAVITDLPDELATGIGLCERLGIACEVAAAEVEPGPTSLLAAMVVREAITNMLRHSSPQRCEITVCTAGPMLEIVVLNDGALREREPSKGKPASSGTGLAEMRKRIEAAGGTFEAGELPGEQFRVLARLPQDNGE